MKKKKEISTWAIIGCFIGIILIIIFARYERTKLYRNIGENMAYSVATITRYSPPNAGVRRTSINLKFRVNDSLFETLARGGFKSPDTKIADSPVGRQYLIVYNAKNPKECIFLGLMKNYE